MNKSPAFQFYAADYLADEHVQLMTLEEEGIYIRLLALCWREGSIPVDAAAVSRLCKNAPLPSVEIVLKRFRTHPKRPDRMVHPRLEKERAKQKEWQQKSVAGGKASAAKRGKSKGGSTTVARVVQPNVNQRPTELVEPKGNSSSSFAFSSPSPFSDPTDLESHTQSEQKLVCVPKSKFGLDEIREYAWASYNQDRRLIALGEKNVDGIRNPDGWAVVAHRSGEFDSLIQEWIDEPRKVGVAR